MILDLLKSYSKIIQLNDLSRLEKNFNEMKKFIAMYNTRIEDKKKTAKRSNFDKFVFEVYVEEQKICELMLTFLERRISDLTQKKE